MSDATAERPRCFWIIFCTSSVLSYSPGYVRESRAPLKMTRTIGIVWRTWLEYQTEFGPLHATGGRL
eukprot:9472856-Pyramimonas_sp.AAC.1